MGTCLTRQGQVEVAHSKLKRGGGGALLVSGKHTKRRGWKQRRVHIPDWPSWLTRGGATCLRGGGAYVKRTCHRRSWVDFLPAYGRSLWQEERPLTQKGKNGALGRRDDHIPSRGKESWIRTRSGQGRAGEGHSFRVGTWHGEEGRDHIPGWAGLVHEGQERTIILIISLCSSPLLPMRRVLGTLDIVACWR